MPVDSTTPEPPLYIEMIGPSGVGKTTVLRLVAQGLKDKPVTFRGGTRKYLFRNMTCLLRRWGRIIRFFRLYSYLHSECKVPILPAIRRAAYVTGVPAYRGFMQDGNGALLIDEGPVGYLLSCGGYGDAWKEWTTVLLPDEARIEAFFVSLTASDTARESRAMLRERPGKDRMTPSGKEAMTPDLRAKARQYWISALSAAGAYCIEIQTDNQSPGDIAQEILEFIKAHSSEEV